MAKKKKSPVVDSKSAIDLILTDELDIELEDSLTPTTSIEPANDEDLLIHYILIRIEEELELEIPAEAAARIHNVQNVYDLVASLQTK